MKQLCSFLLLLAAALLPFDGSAAPVTVSRAQARAAAFFAQSAATRTTPQLRLVWDGETARTRSSAEPALYVFNRTDAPGFVIVAGDDAAAPVLGYSFENRFGDVNRMPANLRYWLEGMRDMILDARAQGLSADAAWSAPSKASTPVRELHTALWDQGLPYNGECPILPNGTERAVTGCIQTAEAIVMKYHRWPQSVNKTLPTYKTKTLGQTIPSRTMGSFDYDLLPDVYDANATEAQRKEVARLMADLGVLNQANYNYSKNGGTGAYSTDQYTGLVTVLGYDKSATLENRPGYSDAEWIELLRKEIAENRPVLYSGSGQEGGHAFVLDGSSDGPEFYFNWGWSGSGNGWYSVAAVGSNHPFPQGQDAIIGLKPDPNGTSQHADKLVIGAQGEYAGLISGTDRIVANTPFTVAQFGYVWNMGATTYDGKIALAVYAADGTQKEFVRMTVGGQQATEIAYSVPAGRGKAYNALTCQIAGPIRPGDRIAGAFWNRSEKRWERMRAYTEATSAEILLMAEALNAEAIAAATSLAYERTGKKITLQTIADLKCRITDGSGAVKYDATTSDAAVTIDASKWAAGTYTLTLTADGGAPYTLRLVL